MHQTNACKLTFEGGAEGILLDVEGEEVAVGEVLGKVLGLFDAANPG